MYETKNVYNIDFVQGMGLLYVTWLGSIEGGGRIVITYEES